ncbi:unnamed protein product [Lupinus luteus]|uniref:Disease resistance protein n=1 Tax=Lupinus luteus TaxID=3873 RepID=A0AAV1WFK2_LUPLU
MSVSRYKYLRILDLSDSTYESLPESTGVKFPTLRTLTITKCGSLKSLPLDINHFPQLETLLVENCEYLDLTKRCDDLYSNLNLKAIRLHSLPQLSTLPSWLQESTNTLQSLLVVDCKNLKMLPEWVSTLTLLVSFRMVNCPKLMFLPNDFHRLTTLRYFRIEGCLELCRKCQPQVGEYWSKIYRINQIFIDQIEDLKEDKEEE